MSRTSMRYAALLLGVAVALSVAPGRVRAQSPGQAPAQGQAGLRVAHMSPGAPPQVDVFVDGQRAAGPVAYQSVSNLQNVPPGSHEIKVTAAGQNDPAVLTTRRDMQANRTYTIVVTGGPGDIQPVALEDDLTPAPDGRGRLRFVNAVPNTRVNVIADNGETWFQSVDYRNVTDFRDVPAGTYTLRVRDANTNLDLTTIPNVAVPSRGSAAAFATGAAQFGGAPVQQAPPAMARAGAGGLSEPTDLPTSALLGGLAVVAVLVVSAAAIRAASRRSSRA